MRAYVGCRTTAERRARGQGIVLFEAAPDGRWVARHTTPAGDNPSFLCLAPDGRTLYAVQGDGGAASAFSVAAADGRLTSLGTWPVEGRNPVHLAMSPDARWLVVACYASGNVSCLPVHREGGLGPVASRLVLPGSPGPVAAQQRGSHPHQVVFDPSGRWLLVPDKGVDRLHTLVLDAATGRLALANSVALPAGSGPRHLVFTRDGRRLYLACELASAVMACEFDAHAAAASPVGSLPTIPAALAGNTAAGIALAADERTLYVSNRGHDSVALFDVEPASGRLARAGWRAAGGRTPRFIAALPVGGLLVANEDTDSLCRLGPADDTPFPLAHTGSPVCVVFTQDFP